jgi:tetratricopeptide (TPR) repeat protein
MPHKTRNQINEIQSRVLTYIRLQRHGAAEDLLKSSIETHGPLPDFLNLLGLCFHQQSKFNEAIEYFEKARNADSGFIEASLNLAVTLSDLGFYDASQKIYSETQSLLNSNNPLPDQLLGRLAHLHTETASGYEQAGLLEQAAAEYTKGLQLYPNMPHIRFQLIKLYLKTKSFQLGREQLMLLLEDNPHHPEFLNLLGAISFRMGDWKQAESYWKKVQIISPNDKTSQTYLRSCLKQPNHSTR